MEHDEEIDGFEAFVNTMAIKSGSTVRYMTGDRSIIFDSITGYLIPHDSYSFTYEHMRNTFKHVERLIENGVHTVWKNWIRMVRPTHADTLK
jgi:hypothetical protein